MVNLDDAGYWNSPEQCLAAEEIRSMIGLLAKAHAELEELKETCINHVQIQNALLAERDAALADVEYLQKCVISHEKDKCSAQESFGYCFTENQKLYAVLREAKSALLLTQEGSEFAACLPDEWSFAADKDNEQMKQAIATINKVLGEE